MPLQTLATPGYIKRTKVFTSFRADGDQVITYQNELKNDIQNVIGVELKAYRINPYMAPTLVGDYPDPMVSKEPADRVSSRGNHLIDIRITHPSGSPVMNLVYDADFAVGEIAITGQPMEPSGVPQFIQTIQSGILLLITQDPNFATVWNQFNPSTISEDSTSGANTYNNMFRFTMQDTVAPFDYAKVEFLFGSGPNASESMAKVLGFKEGVDTTPDPVTNGAHSDFPLNLTPFRYFDVNIRELPEFKPHSRIFMPLGRFSQPSNPNPRNVRILERPLRRMETLTISITLERGTFVGWAGDQNHELEFEVLSMEPGINIPGWVDQEFIM